MNNPKNEKQCPGLIQHPGLVFPMSVMSEQEEQEETSPVRQVRTGITTREVAERLMCSHTAARQLMLRREVEHVLIASKRGGREMVWRRSEVEAMLANHPPTVVRMDKWFLSTRQVLEILSVVRSKLHRLTKQGLLPMQKVRMLSARGYRIMCFYLARDVEKVKK